MQSLNKSSKKVKNSVEAFAACLCQCIPNCICCPDHQPTAMVRGVIYHNQAGISAGRATIMGDTGVGS